jgi:hypothetical protein
MKANYIFILLGLFWVLGCKKEIQLDNNDKNLPLELRYSDGGGGTLSWGEVKVTSFERYVLTKRGAPSTVGSGPVSNAIIFESTDYTQISAPAFTGLSFDTVNYYRLYARVNGRWLESNEIVVQRQIQVVSGLPIATVYYPDSNWVITLKTESNNGATGKLVVSDLNKDKTYSSNTTFPISINTQIAMAVGQGNSGPELYVTTSSTFRRLSLPTLTQLSQHTGVAGPYSVAQTGYNTLLFTHENSTKSMVLRRKSDFGVIKDISDVNWFNRRLLAVLDTTPTGANILEASDNSVRVFHINNSTGTLTNIQVTTDFGNGSLGINVPVSKDRQIFMANGSGNIRDRNLGIVSSISVATSNIFMTDAVFSDSDPDIIYVTGVDFFLGQSVLRKIRISNPSDFIDFPLTSDAGLSHLGKVKGGIVGVFLNQSGGNARFIVRYINF